MQQRFDAIQRLRFYKEQGMDEDIADGKHMLPEEKVFCAVFFTGWPEILPHINALAGKMV